MSKLKYHPLHYVVVDERRTRIAEIDAEIARLNSTENYPTARAERVTPLLEERMRLVAEGTA